MRTIVVAAAALAVAGTAALAQQKTPAESVALARKVASANAFAIQSSELAQDRAQSDDIKAFAKQMIADHAKVGQEFRSAIEAANIAAPLPEDLDAKQKSVLSKLRNTKGLAFDGAYLTAQLAGHKAAVSLLRKYAKSGRTPQLKEVAQKTLPIEEQHLSQATELRNRAIAARRGRTGVGGRAIGPPAERTPMRDKKP